MIRDGLVDELHLFVFPLALGSGGRLFDEGDPPAKFALARADAYDSGVARLSYRQARGE
jgi:dihydrofolate reductase